MLYQMYTAKGQIGDSRTFLQRIAHLPLRNKGCFAQKRLKKTNNKKQRTFCQVCLTTTVTALRVLLPHKNSKENCLVFCSSSASSFTAVCILGLVARRDLWFAFVDFLSTVSTFFFFLFIAGIEEHTPLKSFTGYWLLAECLQFVTFHNKPFKLYTYT